jgi:hypothetical protein
MWVLGGWGDWNLGGFGISRVLVDIMHLISYRKSGVVFKYKFGGYLGVV